MESVAAKTFNDVAKTVDSAAFGITSEQALFDEINVSGEQGIVLFKKFDELRNDFDGEFTSAAIKSFIHANQLALVSEFNQEVSAKSFKSN